MTKKISILGSTGSIGTQALDIVRSNPERFEIKALSCGGNIDLLRKQIIEFKPDSVCVGEKNDVLPLKADFPFLKIHFGSEGIFEILETESDLILNSLVGMRGMMPTYRAACMGFDVALANKEALVAGGLFIISAFEKGGGNLIPVDSEHSAIFQCLEGNRGRQLRRIILTASGGPFRGYDAESLRRVKCEDALNHPSWNMGKKISIDSATLMNKGLEVIEAKWLFDLSADKISVLVHPEAKIHSMVEYCDGAIIAQLGPADMRIPIGFAFNYPDRLDDSMALDIYGELSALTFAKPDMHTFPCLKLAYDALNTGGSAAIALNGANEYLVSELLAGRLEFWKISHILQDFMSGYIPLHDYGIEDISEIDAEVRKEVALLSRGF